MRDKSLHCSKGQSCTCTNGDLALENDLSTPVLEWRYITSTSVWIGFAREGVLSHSVEHIRRIGYGRKNTTASS
jgi:hypothetical protein